MIKQFFPHKSEIPLLLDGWMMALVRPTKETPGEGCTDKQFLEFCNDLMTSISPFGIAKDILWCKEPWFRSFDEGKEDLNPAISMPKSACRLWLEVLEVKVCKTEEVTDEMALSLGFIPIQKEEPIKIDLSPKESFNWFWDREYSGKEWLWYASIRRIEKP